ncbi:MAG TPA: bifunctional UDP-sugar hydrolase/5'-nucleotidase [Polyangiaceae bacterium]|nr:bifunctional UDP-sugar hydrolase/5'-nucleotidase [Polyangiaceae bacterium]
MTRFFAFVLGVASLLLACGDPRATRSRGNRPESLVLIHTADLHSHLFPERQLVSQFDESHGLGQRGELAEVGGVARVATVIATIRAGARQSLYLDSGDLVEGTAAFDVFGGEPELRAFSALGLGAAALGNHDLSMAVEAFSHLHMQFARFPVLAANIADNGSELASALAKSVVLQAHGAHSALTLEVGVIGVANPTSPPDLARADNPYGIELVPIASAVQSQIDRLRPEVDVLVAVSHLGLEGDERLIDDTTGLDVVLGGHQHLALDAALERMDCGPALAAERGCSPQRVVVVHSGALGRYVGELDLELGPALVRDRSNDGPRAWAVASAEHSLIPISADLAADPAMADLLEPYRERLLAAGFYTPLALALAKVERYAEGGADSALGNLVTDAMRAQSGADIGLLNATGLRADLAPGELTRAAFAAALPFDDTLTVLTLSGAQLQTLFNRQARVASDRDCRTPVQISGLNLSFKCSGAASSARLRMSSGRTLVAGDTYTLVTSAYLADGASGFEVLTEARARRALESTPLDATLETALALPSCTESALPCLDPRAFRDQRISLSPD